MSLEGRTFSITRTFPKVRLFSFWPSCICFSFFGIIFINFPDAWGKGEEAKSSYTNQEEVQPKFIPSGTPGTIESEKWWFEKIFDSNSFVCKDFSVRVDEGVLSKVIITSIGLGHTTFLPISDASDLDTCSELDSGAHSAIVLREISHDAQKIRIIIPESSFPNNPGAVKGEIHFFVYGEEPIKVPILLKSQDWGTFFTAIFWFLGIAIPGLVTTFIAYRLYIFQRRWDLKNAEQLEFNTYLNNHWQALDSMFTDYYPILCRNHGKDPKIWCDQLYEKLRVTGLETIPRKYRDNIRKALASNDQKKVKKLLAKIYPTWKTMIES